MVMGPKQVAEWLAQLEKDNAKQGNKLQLLNQDQQKQQPEAMTLASLYSFNTSRVDELSALTPHMRSTPASVSLDSHLMHRRVLEMLGLLEAE